MSRGTPSEGGGRDSAAQARAWVALILAALGVIFVLERLGLSMAMLIGPMLVGIAFGLRGSVARLNGTVFQFAQGVTGCLVAQNFSPAILGRLVDIWPATLFTAVLTLFAAAVAGVQFSRGTMSNLRETLWGFLPGMAGSVVALARGNHLPIQLVATIQVTRLVCVVAIMSAIPQFIGAPALVAPAFQPPLDAQLIAVALSATGILASWLFSRMSSIATIVPLLIGAALQGSGLVQFALPSWLVLAAFFVIGIDIGLKFTPEILRQIRLILLPLFGAVGLLILICAAGGVLIAWLGRIDMATALLATMPGSIDSVTAIATHSAADLIFISTLQITRLFAVLLLGPPLINLLCRRAPPP
ncbi:AbrB family transcriptional regulator [Devosia sp. A369]